MSNKIIVNENNKGYKTFEDIKNVDEFGNEYWLARELQIVLEYKQWRRFEAVISRAKISCKNSGAKINDHFANIGKMVKTGDSIRKIEDYKLSRYACYLITQNGDSRKKVIALAQTYFAIQTRKQELLEKEYENLTEDEKRLSGYKGLYNGETANDIAKRKGLRYREDILDNMGSDELIANLFRISQTEQKLKRENVKTENIANKTHFEMGKDIRNFILEQGGTMPEDLPTPERSLKQIEKESKFINNDK